MTIDDVLATLARLAERRPVFHSEADFQLAFAWQLQTAYPDSQIQLEVRPRPHVRLDVLFRSKGKRTAFELKYFARGLSISVDGEQYDLPSQGAQDVRSYDYCRDIERLEQAIRESTTDDAFAIAITNDSAYWLAGRKLDSAHAAFRLTEGRTLAGIMDWAAHTGAGTKRNREQPIALQGAYTIGWRDFSAVDGRYGSFRCLIVRVGR